jgi:hypothetical protein
MGDGGVVAGEGGQDGGGGVFGSVAGDGGGGAGGPGAGGPTPKWVGGLSSDFGGPQILSQIPDSDQTATVPVTLIKNYVEGQRAIGGMTAVPKDGDDPAKFEKFYQSIGRPEKPDGYELKPPTGTPDGFYNAEELSEFQSKAHSLGIPKKAAEALFAWRAEKDLAVYNEFTGKADAGYQENITALKAEWGGNFSANADAANKAAIWAGGKELAQLLQQAGLVGHPVIAKAFHKIGSVMGEDTLRGVDVSDPGGRQKYTADQLREMTADPRYQKSEEFRKEVAAGYADLHSGTSGGDLNPSRPRTR